VRSEDRKTPQNDRQGARRPAGPPNGQSGFILLYLAVSYDHRIIDGREAVLFLSTIKEALEYPGRVLLDL